MLARSRLARSRLARRAGWPGASRPGAGWPACSREIVPARVASTVSVGRVQPGSRPGAAQLAGVEVIVIVRGATEHARKHGECLRVVNRVEGRRLQGE